MRQESEAYADMHMHSLHSDGSLTPTQIVEYAAGIGLKAISLTDHDCVEGIEEAMEVGNRLNVEIIPGLELSATIDDEDIHILGYFVDYSNQKFRETLELFKKQRLFRAERIVSKLNKIGIGVKIEAVYEKAGNAVIGRPHIASAVVDSGFADTYNSVFQNYIGFGCPAYEKKFQMSPQQAVEMVNEVGGVAVLAHPSMYMKHRFLKNIIEAGIDGIETVHPKHSPQATRYFKGIVSEYFLLETGGSDCHARGGEIMIGKFPAPYSFVEAIKNRLSI